MRWTQHLLPAVAPEPGNSARVDQPVGLKAPDRTPVDQLVPKGSRAFAWNSWRGFD
jgi:hypothetical protein